MYIALRQLIMIIKYQLQLVSKHNTTTTIILHGKVPYDYSVNI